MEQLVRVHIPATVMSVGFTNDQFVASEIAPPVRVPKTEFSYYEFSKTRFRIPQLLRAPKTEFKRGDIGVEVKTGETKEYGWEEPIDDSERTDFENDIDLEMEKAEDATDIVLLGYEKRVATLLRSTSNLTQNITLSGTSQFNDYTNSDPVGVFQTGRKTIHKATGKMPNLALISFPVFETLREHPKVRDHFKYTSSASITAEMLARFFELGRVVVAGALEDTAKEGQTESLDYVWGKDIIMAYVAPRPGKYRPSLAYTFWTPVKGQRRVVEMYREEKITSDILRVHEKDGEKLIHAKCGYLIKNAIA